MAHVNVDQYITTAQTAARVQRLNQAVLDLEVLPVIGGSGSGKRAFLEWWWQGGCADTEFAGDYPINSHEILLVRARHPGSSASVVSDVLTGLEVARKELERANMHGEPPQPHRDAGESSYSLQKGVEDRRVHAGCAPRCDGLCATR